jgi:plastocyanin
VDDQVELVTVGVSEGQAGEYHSPAGAHAQDGLEAVSVLAVEADPQAPAGGRQGHRAGHDARALAALCCTAALTFAGIACGDSGRPDSTAADAANEPGSTAAAQPVPAAGDGHAITLKLIAFAPTRLEVAAGTIVTWRQDDVASHTVTSGRVVQAGGTVTAQPDGRFDSGTISKGQNFRFTFSEPGEYPFFCAVTRRP